MAAYFQSNYRIDLFSDSWEILLSLKATKQRPPLLGYPVFRNSKTVYNVQGVAPEL